MKPQCAFLLHVLSARPGEWVSALDFKRGTFGESVDAVSQRMGDLKRAGYPIESTGRGAVASYRIIPAVVHIPTVTLADGQMGMVLT